MDAANENIEYADSADNAGKRRKYWQILWLNKRIKTEETAVPTQVADVNANPITNEQLLQTLAETAIRTCLSDPGINQQISAYVSKRVITGQEATNLPAEEQLNILKYLLR